MNIKRMRRKIEKAVRKESASGELRAKLTETAKENGAVPDDESIQSIVTWLEGYVRSVPDYLEEAVDHASSAGLSRHMDYLVDRIEAYWSLDDDFIPDHLGLFGLLDDAFASTFLLETLSDYCKSNGRTLLDEAEDLAKMNASVRRIIGPEITKRLEAKVLDTFNQAATQNWLSTVVAESAAFNTPNPVWGHATASQLADVHLGALGIDTTRPW